MDYAHECDEKVRKTCLPMIAASKLFDWCVKEKEGVFEWKMTPMSPMKKSLVRQMLARAILITCDDCRQKDFHPSQ
eukprot:457582-Karenia_brevis.AAC.1